MEKQIGRETEAEGVMGYEGVRLMENQPERDTET